MMRWQCSNEECLLITAPEPADIFEKDDRTFYTCPHCDQDTELFKIGVDKGDVSYKTNTRRNAR